MSDTLVLDMSDNRRFILVVCPNLGPLMSDTLVLTLILVVYPDLGSLMSDTLVVYLILVVYPDLGSLMSDTLVVTYWWYTLILVL